MVNIRKRVQRTITAFLLVGMALFLGVSPWEKQAVLTQGGDSHPDLYVQPNEAAEPMPEKTVYLTYDDGPSKNTGKILDVLKKYNVKAAFFVIGKEDASSQELYRRIVEEGHTLAIHTYSHQYREIYQSVESYLKDFEKAEHAVYQATGIHPAIFRFPGGSANSLVPSQKVHREIIQEMTRRGYVFYDWNVVSGDDTATVYPARTLADRVIDGAKKVKHPVVLFHDAPICVTTPEATEIVIQYFLEQGYEFAALSEQVQPIQFASHSD